MSRFTAASGTALRKQMDKLVVERPVVDMGRKKRPNVTWVRHELVAEVAFRAWTSGGKLRHASHKGLRDTDDAADVYELD